MILAFLGIAALIIGGLRAIITFNTSPFTIGEFILLICFSIALFVPIPENIYLVDKVETENITLLDDSQYYEIAQDDGGWNIQYAVDAPGTGRILKTIETEKIHVNETTGSPYLVINRKEPAPFIRLFFLCGEMPFYPKLNAGVKSVEIYVP
ncbi:hypothetical protein [Eubacterium sp. An3]|uniref:hypothetical protein n=1 Tax=Eubacterium sp. An3 TaxID=1965628 RepID=UPI000B3A64BF|nr:hypothetical protein [Eubacterium sp. An3]OUO24502.1 hypothetical protein B5F87_19870 [Eubacterium sp. An3]